MGLSNSLVKVQFYNDSEDVDPTPVYPNHPRKPLKQLKDRSPGHIIDKFSAVPENQGQPNIENPYWWIDCQFVPWDDTKLITMVTAYQLRVIHTWLQCSRPPAGQIRSWNLDDHSCTSYKHTRSNARPRVSIHPSKLHIGYVDRVALRVIGIKDNQQKCVRNKDFRQNNFKCCAFSPDGRHFAALSRINSYYELHVMRVNQFLTTLADVPCHQLVTEFHGNCFYTDEVFLKWSPDSTIIALSSSVGAFFAVSRYDPSTVQCNIVTDILNNSTRLYTERTFDFYPQYDNGCVLAMGLRDCSIYICNLNDRKIIHKQMLPEDYIQLNLQSILYSPNGEYLSIALSNLIIIVYGSQSGAILLTLDGNIESHGLSLHPDTGRYPDVTSMSYSSTGEQLAVGYSDGNISLWQLIPCMTLKAICRQRIQEHCSMKAIPELGLPNSIAEYLLHH